MVNLIYQHFRWLAVVTALVCLADFTGAAEVSARLDRESVAAGKGAVLTITISGSRTGRPEIPEVDKMIVQPRGQNQQFRMENGRTSISVTYTYAIGSNVPGDYEIPAIPVDVDGESLKTQPLKLKVLESGAVPPPQAGGTAGAAGAEDDKRFGFLTVELAANDRKHVYVGEIAPARIRAWIPLESQTQLRSTVQPEGSGFTLHNLSERPQQTQEQKDGKSYLVVTWFGGISATKAGNYPASLSVDATVAVRDTSAPRPRRRRGAFGDPFFDSAFDRMNAPMIQKDVTLKSVDQEIEVRALPEEGRPDGFGGAIGKFDFGNYRIPAQWRTGEPQQIQAELKGKGNFALADAPELVPADGWKTYAGKDQFAAGDQASFAGTKTFQFSAVPQTGGTRSESLRFSYFDPDAAAYKTLETPAQRVEIVGEDIAETDLAEAPTAPEPPKKEESGLIGQHFERRPAGTLVPFAFRPGFVITLGVAGAMFLLGPVLALVRRRRTDPLRRAVMAEETAVREAREAAARAAEAGDVAGFFAAGRLVLQERLGGRWNKPARAITAAEVLAEMPEDSPVTRFFREADQIEYNRSAGSGEMPRWRALLDEALASISTGGRR